jgi:cytoskeletal protein CcmA (bactofilin family)
MPEEVRRPVEPKPSRSGSAKPASLGPSISISGNLSGNEDLVIEGSVEGEVRVNDHLVTISQTGRVKADVYGRSICVEGEVKGNLIGDEQVIIRQSGRVRGNVTAPRVNLENGAKFKGSIDMQPADPAATATGKKAETSRPTAGKQVLADRKPVVAAAARAAEESA